MLLSPGGAPDLNFSPLLCVQVYEEPVTVMNSEQERPFMCSAPGCSQVRLIRQ